MRVGAVMAGEYRGWLDAARLEHVGKAHAGPFRAAGAAVGPLVAAGLGIEERAAVAAAFEHHAPRDRTELGLQLTQGELELVVHLAIDRELPLVRFLGLFRDLPVVADVKFGSRRGGLVEQMLGRLGDQRTVAEHDQAFVLAGEVQWLWPLWWRGTAGRGAARLRLRQRRRNEAARHGGGERNRSAHGHADRRQPGA